MVADAVPVEVLSNWITILLPAVYARKPMRGSHARLRVHHQRAGDLSSGRSERSGCRDR